MDWGCGSKLQRDKPWIRFISAIFLSLTIMTSVGYGVLHVVNTMKMIFIIFYMLFNLGYRSLLAWLVFTLGTNAFFVLLAITFLRSRLRLSLQTGVAARVLLFGFVFLWIYFCCCLFSCETVWQCSSVSIVGCGGGDGDAVVVVVMVRVLMCGRGGDSGVVVVVGDVFWRLSLFFGSIFVDATSCLSFELLRCLG
ncbi:putative potassium channel domain-containing protein [Medicago truncatula]|uniref:Ion channel protein n=1 Tax=Medicago truncatula TaxID=3880 RepID=G7JW90_MEDTR|nr:ion channel protein [Medicago truncatula]RHN54330.1 putative potassium channel domain-containing protein [Medicago truncatula]